MVQIIYCSNFFLWYHLGLSFILNISISRDSESAAVVVVTATVFLAIVSKSVKNIEKSLLKFVEWWLNISFYVFSLNVAVYFYYIPEHLIGDLLSNCCSQQIERGQESVNVLRSRADLLGKQVFHCTNDCTISLYFIYLDGIRSTG